MTNTFDDIELYFIQDIRRPHRLNTGVRPTAAIRQRRSRELALERFICRMQIIILNVILKRRPAK